MNYIELQNQAKSLIDGENHPLPALSNISALIYTSLDRLNWAGFYLIPDSASPDLMLGPFQGKVACIRIPLGRGVCGTAAERDKTILVEDVHKFPGHIACDSASNSEIVVPIHCAGRVIGVLDIDSPATGRFGEDDRVGLEALVRILESAVDWNRWRI